MIWKKDPNMKYTDMCKYIDAHSAEITNPGENSEVEELIYNYLWLLVKALAIKKHMFNNFQDYDPYAFYAANRLFFAIRNNNKNQGKVIKGKTIRPIKNILDYTKMLLNPMKIEYQREAYREIISEEFVSKKFDAFSYKEQMKADAKYSQGVNENFRVYLIESLTSNSQTLDKVLQKSPFSPKSAEYKHLKISILLNSIAMLKTKKKLNSTPVTIILWKLPKSMSSYVRVLLKEFFTEIKKEIMECYEAADIKDDILEKLITLGDEGEKAYEEQY